MEKRNKVFFTVFLIVLFFISSCGIPSFLSCYGNIVRNGNGQYTTSLYDFHINASAIDFNSLKSQIEYSSPSLTFFYTITNVNNQDSRIVNKFNNEFSSIIGKKPKSASIGSQFNPVITEKIGDKNLHLYLLGNSYYSSNFGHLNRLQEQGDDSSFTFTIEKILLDDNQGYEFKISYLDINGKEDSFTLSRFNNTPFTKELNGNDYSYVSNDGANIYINIYVAMNVIGNGNANFTNRLWSDLYYVNSFELN